MKAKFAFIFAALAPVLALAQVTIPVSNISPATSATWATRVTDETGTGLVVFNNSPVFITPVVSSATANTLNYFNGSKTESSVTLSGLTLSSGTLSVDAATTSAAGKVELATDAEAVTGTSTSLVPSAASMRAGVAPLRNALAPAQRLAFDGSSGVTIANGAITIGPLDFLLAFRVNPAAYPFRVCGSTAAGVDVHINSALEIVVNKSGASEAKTFAVGVALGKTSLVTVRRTAGLTYIGVNGVETAGIADTSDYGSATNFLGAEGTLTGGVPTGELALVAALNHAPTADEIRALYEGNNIAAADLFPALNGVVDAQAYSLANNGGVSLNFTTQARKGQTVRVRFTTDASSGNLQLTWANGGSVTGNLISVLPGLVTTYVCPADGYIGFYMENFTGDTAAGVISVDLLGAFCLPESAQIGAGSMWLDASGRALPADLLLPAAGVTWALPAARNPTTTTSTLTYSSTAAIDFATESIQTVTLTGDVTFTTANLAAGRSKTVRIICDSSTRAFTFPVGWVFVGTAAPATAIASKTGVLSLTAFGTADSTVVAAYAAQP